MNETTESNISRKVFLYGRVSTDMQQNGLESQVRALKLFCEQNGLTHYELFMDEAISGAKLSRPALNRMMAAIERELAARKPHRNGRSIDLSLHVFNSNSYAGVVKKALNLAVANSGLRFPYSWESPANSITKHWHVQK